MSNIKYSIKRYSVSPEYLSETRTIYKQREYLNPIIYKNDSRYKNLRTLYNEDRKVIVHENWNKVSIPISDQDNYYIVDMLTENRLDIIANSYYNSPRYWWVIALANNIDDPFDVPRGTNLRIPLLSSIAETIPSPLS